MRPDEHLPSWASRFLRTICPAWLVEEIEGDLVQKYEFDIKQYGASRARRKLISNILQFFRPGIIFRNRKFSHNTNQSNMLRNYIVVAMRVSQRQRLYTFINVIGLSVGLAASLLIGLYINDEYSYDKHIAGADRIYRAGINETFKGDEILYSDTGAPLADAMQQEIPEVEDVVRISKMTSPARVGDRAFVEKRMFQADSNFFKFFGFPLSEGNVDECLKGPNKIVLSQSAAKKYFDYDGQSGESPVGKQMIVNRDNKTVEVTGIFPDLPTNTHMKIDMVMSAVSFEYHKNDCWGCYGFKTYFKLTPLADINAVDVKLEEFAQTRIIPGLEKDLNISHSDFEKSGDIVRFFTQPLLSIHLYSDIDDELEPNGDIRYMYILGIIAIFLLIIACINFMNLSTARAISRGKEVGVRKTMGASRRGLFPQFLVESMMYAIVSGVFALLITWIALGPFGDLSSKELSLGSFMNLYSILAMIGLVVMIGFLAGIYPAVHLTSFNPATVLKGSQVKGSSRSIFRNTLVVFQFTISIVLIIGTLIIYKQLNFITEQNLGFDKENVVRIRQAYLLGESQQAFKDELLRHSEFVDVASAQSVPPEISSTAFLKTEGSDQLVSVFFVGTEDTYLSTMGMQMKEGRFLSRQFITDSSAIVINESTARLLNFKMDEQKPVTFFNQRCTVVGVVKNFNFASLKSDVQPLVMFLNKNARANIVIRMASGNPGPKLDLISELWTKYANGQTLEYSFLNEDFDSLFRSEQRLGVVFALFTGLAIFIACLGLFGLITYITNQRTKEIGIRKVLGATAQQVTLLLLSDLIKLVLISFAISIPLAWYGMEQWLQTFAYRTNVDVWSLLVAGFGGLFVAVMTVSFRSMKAASANPVDSLKNE